MADEKTGPEVLKIAARCINDPGSATRTDVVKMAASCLAQAANRILEKSFEKTDDKPAETFDKLEGNESDYSPDKVKR